MIHVRAIILSLILLVNKQALSFRFSIGRVLLSACASVNSTNNMNCEDGICSIDGSSKLPTEETSVNPELKSQISEIVKMGWTEEDAYRALNETEFDVTAAATLLADEDEGVEQLVELGWDKGASRIAIQQCDYNVTIANQVLEEEEATLTSTFEQSVKEMVDNGWAEVVARQALLFQWTLDQRKNVGMNNTVSPEALANIRPSLRKSNETEEVAPKKSPQAPKAGGQKDPKPAKKEDVVFEVNSNNFQEIVLESPVPVLVDVYADWCGPCKQLGPILEQAAIKAGGMFRLVKINSDKERSIAQTLQVTGLPTVYSFVKGKANDRFVGMLPGDQLQQYLVRAVTGFGERVQQEFSDSDFEQTTSKISLMAGLSAIGFKEKDAISRGVAAVLEMPGAFVPGPDGQTPSGAGVALSEGMKTALVYLSNCQKDVRNNKYRVIKNSSKVFSEKVKPNPAALKLLEIAGFRQMQEDKMSQGLELSHFNSAILGLVRQKVDEYVLDRKFSRMRKTGGELKSKVSSTNKNPKPTSNAQNPLKPKQPPSLKSKTQFKATKDQTKTTKTQVMVSLRDSAGVFSADPKNIPSALKVSPEESLREAVEALLKEESDVLELRGLKFEIRFPLPRREIDEYSEEMDMSVGELAGEEGSLNLSTLKTQTKRSNNKDSSTGKKRKRNYGGKSNTLFSTGILEEKKNNEYFGGDSTVFLSKEEENEDEIEKPKKKGKMAKISKNKKSSRK